MGGGGGAATAAKKKVGSSYMEQGLFLLCSIRAEKRRRDTTMSRKIRGGTREKEKKIAAVLPVKSIFRRGMKGGEEWLETSKRKGKWMTPALGKKNGTVK